ncbi:MAG: nucleotidyltransferase domain-containing protein [Elusimicrobia bacterium]|nr:nucleotidyltransferase domain-containing protein [Elusimicrobiota bacterium]
MENNYLEQIKDLVLRFLNREKVRIFLFGSRARKDNYLSSDVDIGILPYGSFDENKMVLLKEKIENLNIPYKIELLDFRYVSKDFKKEAFKNIILWKD